MDSATYRHLMGQLKKSCIIPHSSFPSHNLVSLETLLKVSKDLNAKKDLDIAQDSSDHFLEAFPCYKAFEYDVQMSWPLHCGSGATDVANDLVKKKLEWEKKLKNFRVFNLQKAVTHIKCLQVDNSTKIPENLVQYIDHFHQDPEPNFSGNYNWLYTGGNLLSVEVDNGVILVSMDYFDKNPGLNVLKINKSLNEIDYKSTIQLKTSPPVLQISGQSKTDEIFVCVRQKNSASLFKINGIKGLNHPTKLWRKKVPDTKILTCLDVHPSCQKVVISDSRNDIHQFDVETKEKTFAYGNRKRKSTDSWGQVMFGDLGIYFAGRDSFFVLDPRADLSVPTLIYSPSSATNICEEICSISKSNCNSNFLYFGTTHCLLQMDVRNLKTVQRWTHLMKNSPQFVKCIAEGNSDFVVLQSQKIDETVGVTNDYIRDGNGCYFLSKSLPCFLGGVKESLKAARIYGSCLSPFVAKRFDYSVTGVCCVKDNEGDIHLFTGNSGGDIFITKLRKKMLPQMCINDAKEKTLNAMKIYETHVESNLPLMSKREPLAEVHMKRVLMDLKKPKLKSLDYERSDLHWRYHEMYSPDSLLCYKDALAGKILGVWDFPQNPVESELDTTMSSDMKVRQWMEKFSN